MTGQPEPVLVRRHGHVLSITLNRPHVRNAVDAEVSAAVGAALDQADEDVDTRVVVLTGAGAHAFCAGADLKAVSEGRSVMAPGREHLGFAGFVRHPISKPTIAAVNGAAMGGGTELALAADLVVACESAVFGLPEVKRGLIAAAGGLVRLPQQIAPKVALHMLLTGDPVSATRAREIGLINDVVPDGSALDRALELADRIAANAPLAVQASKRVARGVVGGAVGVELEPWHRSAQAMRAVMSSRDAREGATAFLEKRAPQWSGE